MTASALAIIVIPAIGCGGATQSPHPAEAGNGAGKANPNVEVLREFRAAAESNETYDAYGYFESGYPASQRAALDGFCIVVNEARTGAESDRLGDPAYFSKRVAAAARPEAEGASMTSIRRAVDKLRTVIEPESLSPPLVKSYAKACY